MKRVTRNPYRGVDWDTVLWCKANMHTHTLQSDGAASPAEMIDAYHALNYDILALTDHDHSSGGPSPGAQKVPTWPWTKFGRNPETLGMLAVGPSNEFSGINHVNGYWVNMWSEEDLLTSNYNTYVTNMPWIINEIGVRGGKAQINHPGRYTRSEQFYLDLFDAYHGHLHEIEIYNQGNRYQADLQRWDDLLTLMRSQGSHYPINATSVDDAHNDDTHVGRNYVVYLLPFLTETALRRAIERGAQFTVYDPQGTNSNRHLNGNNGFWTAAPMVERVDITNTHIELDVVRTDSIEWHTDEGTLVGTGETMPLNNENLGGYVRATLRGADSSRTHTQAFYLAEASGLIVLRAGGVERVVTGTRQGGVAREIVDLRRL